MGTVGSKIVGSTMVIAPGKPFGGASGPPFVATYPWENWSEKYYTALPTDLTHLFQDVAKTTPITGNGQQIRSIEVISNNGLGSVFDTAGGAVDGWQYRDGEDAESMNCKPVFNYSGPGSTSNKLIGAKSFQDYATNNLKFTMHIPFRLNPNAADNIAFAGPISSGGGGGPGSRYRTAGGGTIETSGFFPVFDVHADFIGDEANHLYTLRCDGETGNVYLYIDGVLTYTFNSTSMDDAALVDVLGATLCSIGGWFFYDGDDPNYADHMADLMAWFGVVPWYAQIEQLYDPTASYSAAGSTQTNQSNLPANFGDTVRTASDRTGNGYTLNEPSANRGPELVAAGIGDLVAWDFDQTNTEFLMTFINMNAGTVPMYDPDKATIVALVKVEDDVGPTSRLSIVGGHDANGLSWIGMGRRESSDNFWTNAGFGAFVEIADGLPDGVPRVAIMRGDNTDSDKLTANINNETLTDADFGLALNLAQRFNLGRTNRSGYAVWNGKIAGLLTFDRYLTDAELENIICITRLAAQTTYINNDLKGSLAAVTQYATGLAIWTQNANGIVYEGQAGTYGRFGFEGAAEASSQNGNADFRFTLHDIVVPNNTPISIWARASAIKGGSTPADHGFYMEVIDDEAKLWSKDALSVDTNLDTAAITPLADGDKFRIIVKDLGGGDFNIRGYIDRGDGWIPEVESLGYTYANPASLGYVSMGNSYSPGAGYNVTYKDAYARAF